MDIIQIINEAYEKARQILVDETTELKRNRKRSKNWVESLAESF